MVNRLIKNPKTNSLFLLGPRGAGKSTWIKSHYLEGTHRNFYINLLNPKVEDHYRRNPESLSQEIQNKKYQWVIIDEIQKLPHLLDVVHDLIESMDQKFIMTGSSARKLKRGAANMLAGRAFVNYLFPFTAKEMGEKFDLDFSLQWGLLPKITHLSNEED